MPAFEDGQDIAQRRALRRSDDADLARERGDRPFPLGLEKTFLFELLFQLLECELQRTQTCGFEYFDNELIFASTLVRSDAAACAEKLAVFRPEAKQPRGIAKTN